MLMTSKRRGVSPVIATLLLIVIAVAAAVLTYVWVTGYIGRTTSTAETGQLQERIKINAVSVTGTTAKTVTASVANIGDLDVSITAAYVLTSNGTTVCGGALTPAVPLSKGTITDVTVSNSCTLTSGKVYIAKVVTSKGTEATYTFTAP
jgi:flagellin-like protein